MPSPHGRSPLLGVANHQPAARYYVYALLDPRTDEMRYIGQCAVPVADRLRTHMNAARTDPRVNPRLRWLRTMQADGVTPIALTLAEFDEPTAAAAAEVWWIACLRAEGVPLTNETAGGKGVRDPSPETREKLRARKRGVGFRSEAQRTKAMAALAAKRAVPGYVIPVPDQTGYKHTEETKAKMRAAAARRRVGDAQ